MAERLDKYLVDKGLAKSRERAKALISAGSVRVNGRTVDKPSVTVSENDEVTAGEDMRYVGRGALKLIKALDCFDIGLGGLTCADLGASTGGFTQVMLERGAAKVYAVDVGHGQLDRGLAADSRVVDLEGVNVRDITDELIPERLPFVSADLSFISLRNVADVFARLLSSDGRACVLIKPQFEAGRAALGKNGTVKDPADHIRAINEVSAAFAAVGLYVNGLTFSPVKGGSGNVEYLALLARTPAQVQPSAEQTVKAAFAELGK